MKKKKKYYRRLFLNMRGFNAGAHIIADVNFREEHANVGTDRERHWKNVDAALTIADCSRTVTLDFGASDYDTNGGEPSKADQGELKNMLYKVRILREVVNGFADAIEEAAKELDL